MKILPKPNIGESGKEKGRRRKEERERKIAKKEEGDKRKEKDQ